MGIKCPTCKSQNLEKREGQHQTKLQLIHYCYWICLDCGEEFTFA